MEWNQLFLKKEDWQRNTFNEIKNRLISAKDNRFVRYDNSEEDHLVMVYGKSQVGKTTLILNMIGIKDEYFREVYNTLRAGVPRGNSSTSTAIIYSKSSNGQYGCTISTISDSAIGNVKYYDKNGMMDQLIRIRSDVESNRLNTESILFIYIPDHYFVDDPAINSISIMDMPGVESRNRREDIHVRNLMTRYIPISSVCIIVCRSNEIQSLETAAMPNQMDWKRMDHRFILVITHSYNDGTTKNYFKINPSVRKEGFYDHVTKTYTHEIRRILGSNNKTEVYPIDIGDTLLKLCTEEIKNESDRKEIIAAKDRILSDIRDSIVSHKGERLKSALTDLKTIADHYGEDEIDYILNEISVFKEKIENKKYLIEITKRNIETLNGEDSEKDELKDAVSSLKGIRRKLPKPNGSVIDKLSSEIEQKIISSELKLYKDSSKGRYLNDKNKTVIYFLREYISEQTEQFISTLIGNVNQTDPDFCINRSEVIIQAECCIFNKEDELFPPKKGIFSRKEKVYFENMRSVFDSIQEEVNRTLNSYVRKAVEYIDDLISEKEAHIQELNRFTGRQDDKISQYNKEVEGLMLKITDLEEQKREIEERRQKDSETLAMYLKYANEEFLKQRNGIVDQINNGSSPEEKLLLFLFLGLLDKDYQKITGGIDENTYQYSIAK